MKPNAMIAACALALTLGTAAQAATYNFLGNICGNPTPGACFGTPGTNGSAGALNQGYADTPGANVTYDRTPNAATISPANLWNGGYETFLRAIYGNSGDNGLTIDIFANPGYEVDVQSVLIAPYANRERESGMRITDLGTSNILFEESIGPVSTAGITTFAPLSGTPWTSTTGIQIFLTGNSWDVGIGEFAYTTSQIDPGAVIPLPAAGWMLLTGLGGLVALRRRKTQG